MSGSSVERGEGEEHYNVFDEEKDMNKEPEMDNEERADAEDILDDVDAGQPEEVDCCCECEDEPVVEDCEEELVVEVEDDEPCECDCAEEELVVEVEDDEPCECDCAEESELEDADTAAEAEEVCPVEEEVVEEVEEEEEPIPSMEETEAALDFEPLQPGDVVQGTIVQINDENVLVDVRYKSDGVIPLSELKLTSGQKPQDVFTVGQEIPVYILSVDGRDGAVLASYRRALDEIAWDRLYKAKDDLETQEVPVVEEVKGGLVLDVYGLRGFMPASHVDRGFVSDLSQYVGQSVRARVIELDRNKNRIILSRKTVLEEEHEQQKEETWAVLEEGEVRQGVVKGITDFGAFVDLGGVDGLLHVSQMSWGRVDHPSDVVRVGDEIEVKVLRVDRNEDKISLGLKQMQPDPWESVDENYAPGQVVEGRVMRIAPFGSFVELEPGVEGLVHISELADYHVAEPSEVVSEGEDVLVKVLRVQPEERRISLSLKEARREQDVSRHQRRTGGLTLGDVFGDLLTETRERLSNEEKRDKDKEDEPT